MKQEQKIEQESQDTEVRKRRKTYARQLQDALDAAEAAGHEKANLHVIRLLQSRLEVLAPLAAAEREDAKAKASEIENAERAALKSQHDADTSRIITLEAELASLKNHKCTVTVQKVTDPEHEKTRAERDALKSAIEGIASQIDSKNRQHVAIGVLRSGVIPAVAQIVCQSLGLNYANYSHWIQIGENEMMRVVERADPDANGEYVTFCRAALNVSVKAKTKARKASEPEEPEIRTVEEAREWSKRQTQVMPAVTGDYRPSVRTSPVVLDSGKV